MARKKNKGWVLREVSLNNKSRKGKYVYVKKDIKRASYYKIKDLPLNGNADYYMSLYEGNLGKGRKGVTKREKRVKKRLTHEDILQRAKTSKRAIDKLMGSGIWTTQLEAAFSKSPEDIREAYKELLFKAILSRDPKTLDVLTQDQNIQKFKNRFEFRVFVLDENKSIIADLNVVGTKDMEEVISDMRTVFPRGYKIERGKSPSNHLRESKSRGYNINERGSGRVDNINIRLIMRKAR